MFWETLDAKWGVLKPWGGTSGGGVVALNQKVLDKYLKVFIEEKGTRQGVRLQCPVNPLLPQEVEPQYPSFSSSIAENMI